MALAFVWCTLYATVFVPTENRNFGIQFTRTDVANHIRTHIRLLLTCVWSLMVGFNYKNPQQKQWCVCVCVPKRKHFIGKQRSSEEWCKGIYNSFFFCFHSMPSVNWYDMELNWKNDEKDWNTLQFKFNRIKWPLNIIFISLIRHVRWWSDYRVGTIEWKLSHVRRVRVVTYRSICLHISFHSMEILQFSRFYYSILTCTCTSTCTLHTYFDVCGLEHSNTETIRSTSNDLFVLFCLNVNRMN